MFVGAGVGFLGHSGVGDGGVALWLLSSSLVDNSWTTGVEVDGTYTGRCLVSVPCWFLACSLVRVLHTVLAEAGGTLVSVIISSKFKLC